MFPARKFLPLTGGRKENIICWALMFKILFNRKCCAVSIIGGFLYQIGKALRNLMFLCFWQADFLKSLPTWIIQCPVYLYRWNALVFTFKGFFNLLLALDLKWLHTPLKNNFKKAQTNCHACCVVFLFRAWIHRKMFNLRSSSQWFIFVEVKKRHQWIFFTCY